MAVMYFSLAATLCIAIFVRAHVISRDARDLNAAVNMASDAAEVIRSTSTIDDTNKLLIKMYPDALITGTDDGATVLICFDESKVPCSSEKSYYRVDIRMAYEKGMITALISVTDHNDNELYSLPVNHVGSITR